MIDIGLILLDETTLPLRAFAWYGIIVFSFKISRAFYDMVVD